MDIDLARDVVKAAFRSARELQELLGVLKQRCSSDDYQNYKYGIAKAMAAISVEVINKALADHPELVEEIDRGIAKDGRYV